MQISDFDFPGAPKGPASPRERARARRLRRAPRLIPHPETEMAGTTPEVRPDLEDIREPQPPQPR